MLFFALLATFSFLYEHQPEPAEEIVWEEVETIPFDELILSWNGERPRSTGGYGFLVSVRQKEEWSQWLYYAEWDSFGQIVLREDIPFIPVEAQYGIVKTRKKTPLCDGFRIRVFGWGGANLKEMHKLWVAVANLGEFKPSQTPTNLSSVLLQNVPRQSLITLRHERYGDLAMPTSIATALNCLLGKREVSYLDFADHAKDDDNKGYEYWPLNVAEAYQRLHWGVHVERLNGFEEIHAELAAARPVVVSMRGFVTGGPRPFYRPHALCVIGYDAEKKKVLCIDPAFPNDRATFAAYDLSDFLRVWAAEKNIACIFGENP